MVERFAAACFAVLLSGAALAQQAAPRAPAIAPGASDVIRDGAGSFTDAKREVKGADAAAAAPAQVWVLKAKVPLHVQLAEWAEKAGWDFSWKMDRGYVPPAEARFTGTFDVALEAVVRGLYDEGVPIHLRIWDGNRVAEVVRSTPE